MYKLTVFIHCCFDHIIVTDSLLVIFLTHLYVAVELDFFVAVLHLWQMKRQWRDEVCTTSYWKLAPEVEMCKAKQNKTRSEES